MVSVMVWLGFFYLVGIFSLASIYIVTVSQVRQHIAHADVILVLGCAAPNGQVSGMLRERLNEALLLYYQGYAPYILVSGGVGPGEAVSEARVMQRYLLAHGVPLEHILIENRSRRTWENLSFSKQIIDRYNFRDVIIVTSSFHLARSISTAEQLGYEQVYFSGATSSAKGWQFLFNYLREIPGLLYYLVAPRYLEQNTQTRMLAREVPYIPQHIYL